MSDIGSHPFLKTAGCPAHRPRAAASAQLLAPPTAPAGGPARQRMSLPASAAMLGCLGLCVYFGAAVLIALLNALPLLVVIVGGSFALALPLGWALCGAADKPWVIDPDDDIVFLDVRFKR